ncbi:sulfur-oxidizing protein SoxZ [Gammaproteobacteria bacterium]
MADPIKLKANEANGVTTIKVLITHPMETGTRKNSETGELIPAHFITEVSCTHKDKEVIHANWGAGISANPYLSFRFQGGTKGDEVTLSWQDNLGEKDSIKARIA